MINFSIYVFRILFMLTCFYLNLNAQENIEFKNALTPKHQSIIPIAAYSSTGDLENLRYALQDGLETGLTINEIKEVIIHLYAYCGFPRSIRGLQTFMEVLDERKTQGINDEIGKDATPNTDKSSKYDLGKENLETLIGMSITGAQTGYAKFAPAIEIFLKEHLFADLFERDVLTFAERELVTISVLSSIGGVEPMLHSHLSICLNLGMTTDQLEEFVNIIGSKIGEKEANDARAVFIEVLQTRKSK